MNRNKNSYTHIKSFKDFNNEKFRLSYEIKLAEKKLEIKYIELTAFLNIFKYIPSLLNNIINTIKDLILALLNKEGVHSDEANTKEDESN